MAGALRRMGVYLGLVEEDQIDEVDEYDAPVREPRSKRGFDRSYAREEDDERYESRSVRPLTDTRAVRTFRGEPERAPQPRPAAERRAPERRSVDFGRIETIHPRSYNDARRIGEEYREGVPVIMNLSELDDVDAKRLVDFAAGLVFGMRGSIERVTNKVFLLSPVNVDVGDRARAQLAQDGFFNQS